MSSRILDPFQKLFLSETHCVMYNLSTLRAGTSDEESSDSDFEAVEEKEGFEEEAKSDPVPGPSGLEGSRSRAVSHAGVLAQASTSSSSQEWTLVSRDENEEV